MIVSHKHRFIFLRTEKTGGSSFTTALQSVMGEEDEQSIMKRPLRAKFSPIRHGAFKRRLPQWFGLHRHATAKQVRDVLGKKIFDNYYKFAIERNPWDRQVSLYAHREWKKKNQALDFDRDMRSPIYRNTEYVKLNNWSIYAIGRTIVADRVLRYETLDADIAGLMAELGIGGVIQMPRLRAYSPNREHYSRYYTPWTKDLVARWYAKEIDAFGYRFETGEDARLKTAQADAVAWGRRS
jgi:hypothetical protein